MKSREPLAILAFGLGLTFVLIFVLASTTDPSRADGNVLYVVQGGTGATCTQSNPCGSVQSAIDLATAGDAVWVAAGTYVENLNITRRVNVRGGWDSAFTNQDFATHPTVLKDAGEVEHNVRIGDKDSPLGVEVGLEGLTFQNGNDGIHIWSSDDSGLVVLSNITIQDIEGQGVEVDGATISLSTARIITAQQGIEVDGGTVSIQDVHVSHTLEESFILEKSALVTVTHSTFEYAGQQGIQIDEGTVWFAENTVRHIISEAVLINGGTVVLAQNEISDVISSDYPGIYAEPEGDTPLSLTVTGNHVYQVRDHGIYVRGTTATYVDNTVHDVTRHGLYVREGDATIRHNLVYNVGERGIYARNEDTPIAETVDIAGNTIYDVGESGIDARGCNATITQNVIHGVQAEEEYGIDVRDGRATISHNTVYDIADDGIRSREDSTDVEIYANTVYATQNDGIEARGERVVVQHNYVYGNQDNGIKVERIGENVQVLANRVLSNTGIGIAIRTAPVFTLTNNIVGDHIAGSVTLGQDAGGDAIGHGVLYHNTLVGSGSGQQGVGLTFLNAVEVTAVNNIIVSHTVGVMDSVVATLNMQKVLLWANADNPITSGSISIILPFPALFVDPAHQDYHIRPRALAVDKGMDLGVDVDIDGERRPHGSAPDLGADEIVERTFIYLPLVMRDHPPPMTLQPPSAYYIEANSADLNRLAENPYANETIPATFKIERGWSVDLRYRGDTARVMPKKSWKVYFPNSDPFSEYWELNLNADYIDQTLLRSAVGYDFINRAGVPAPHAGYARLYLNGAYYGLFSQVEQIDERFLHRIGSDIHGNLYKPFYGNLELPRDVPYTNTDWWDEHYPKKTNRDSGREDLWEFMEILAYTPEEDFAETIGAVLDVNGWMDWYATNILIGNFEMLEKNYYLYHDLSTDRWHIFPWDVDLAMGHNAKFGVDDPLLDYNISYDNPIDSGSRQSRKIDGKWNALIDRMMNVPEFRYFHGRRLIELMDGPFSEADMAKHIQAFYESIAPYGAADTRRWRHGDFPFYLGPDELNWYVRHRRAWLDENLPAFMPDLQPPLVLNEMLAGNVATLADEAGDYDPWIELYNSSPALAWDLGGMYLSGDPDHPLAWRIPDATVIPPQEALLIWLDAEPEEGALHANFTLTMTGGTISLRDRDIFDHALIFQTTYPSQTMDTAYGRLPDGRGELQSLSQPTPGWHNVGHAPIVARVVHTPTWPLANMPVTVTATITDETPVTVTLWYRTSQPMADPSSYLPVAMSPVTASGGTVEHYAATLPAQATRTRVAYYIHVVDQAGRVTVDRPGWPDGDYAYIVDWTPPGLVINEIMARNTYIDDEQGATPDWIEIYNPAEESIDMGGMYLTDDPNFPNRYEIPPGTMIPAGGYHMFWADGLGLGDYVNFKLSGAGEAVALFDRVDRGLGRIDVVYFDPQQLNVSWGRFPNANGPWAVMDTPTPGDPNRLHPPKFTQVTRMPKWPKPGETVNVSARITAGHPMISATLWVQWAEMLHAFPLSGPLTYSARIPAQLPGTQVAYYLEAVDAWGQHSFYPEGAPTNMESYIVGYVPPDIVINEFLASNNAVNTDNFGDHDDWVELYNPGTQPVSLEGMYLTDHLDAPDKWMFPPGTVIAPGGYLLVWCDGETDQGMLHTNFKLSREGEAIGLYDTLEHGNVALDTLSFSAQVPNVSYGRYPDGADTWQSFTAPTPGARNE